ncbi:TetR/AcrR family transcriptional regulator [Acinetobacter puyangensis]|uniref:Transcriptional regulator, TetR family n=1 Tax=Acinetobacter puyangensis TaxID=1096779 RepID=A0A240EE72_9GAMM|nr:TetR/AcrR family transcriptional regulator [Acinetobacter puyangensis]SNX46210.1 transcriptional regulator, TetR family [Acinetobacter puyangensis]
MQQRAIDSDARMVEQTILLLCEGGVKAVTLEAVGKRAGYSRGLVTRRYGSKDQLLLRVLNYLARWCLSTVKDVENSKKGIAAICFAIDQATSRIKTHPEYYRALFILWAYTLETNSVVKNELLQLSKKSREQHQFWLLQAQELGEISHKIDTELVVDFIIGQSAGLFNQWLLDPEFKIQDRLHRLIRIQIFLVCKHASLYEEVAYWGE